MPDNPHFEPVPSWQAAAEKLNFHPLIPGKSFAYELDSLSVFVRDHKMRELPIGERSLEAHFAPFVFSQALKSDAEEARHQALEVSYGRTPKDALIAGHAGRVYELGPEPPPDDVDGRSPSVVVWHDGAMFYLLASLELPSPDLVNVAGSLYG